MSDAKFSFETSKLHQDRPTVRPDPEAKSTPLLVPSPTQEVHSKTSSPVVGEYVGGEAPLLPNRVIVIAKLQKEDTDWVQEYLPDWQHAIYTVDNRSAPLHTDVNKGRESSVYLKYIVDNYDRLPETLVFLHSHRDGYPTAWHNDNDDYDNVKSVTSLRIDFVQRNGYTNLRCNWIPGCPEEVQPYRQHSEFPDLKPEDNAELATLRAWPHLFNSTDPPAIIAAPCCAQFAVSRAQVLMRPREDYVRFLQWLLDTDLPDATSGRVFEYLWHIIFGKEAV
ncbi:MAG: hypothetical protein M1833_001269 [Piccolia ochrophora]|nr:MAG: hypothetical protein M1833_001269 [Piccolia ochrophora]